MAGNRNIKNRMRNGSGARNSGDRRNSRSESMRSSGGDVRSSSTRSDSSGARSSSSARRSSSSSLRQSSNSEHVARNRRNASSTGETSSKRDGKRSDKRSRGTRSKDAGQRSRNTRNKDAEQYSEPVTWNNSRSSSSKSVKRSRENLRTNSRKNSRLSSNHENGSRSSSNHEISSKRSSSNASGSARFAVVQPNVEKKRHSSAQSSSRRHNNTQRQDSQRTRNAKDSFKQENEDYSMGFFPRVLKNLSNNFVSTASHSGRDWAMLIILALVFVCIITRLVWVQVIDASANAEKATAAHTNELIQNTKRGTIYDRNGETIASSIEATTIYANPKEIDKPEQVARIMASYLEAEYKLTYQDCYDLITKKDTSFVYIKRKADKEIASKLQEDLKKQKLNGIHYLQDYKRTYPNGDVGKQVVGNVDVDDVGIAGLEMQYEDVLSGSSFNSTTLEGLKGLPMVGSVVSQDVSPEADSIQVSLDVKLQQRCEESLTSALQKYNAKGGSVTVMDAGTGEIYATCSYSLEEKEVEVEVSADETQQQDNTSQSTSNNNVSQNTGAQTNSVQKNNTAASATQANTTQPTITQVSASQNSSNAQNSQNSNSTQNSQNSNNNSQNSQNNEQNTAKKTVTKKEKVYSQDVGKISSISDVYEPGSTFKSLTAASVLSNTSANLNTTFDVPSSLKVYDSTVTDSHEHGDITLSFNSVIAQSSNIGMVRAGELVSNQQLYDTYNSFGIGQTPAIDFPGAASGLLSKAQNWDGVQEANITFGQGVSTSALQMTRAYGALQQKGVLRTPHFLKEVKLNQDKTNEYLQKLNTQTTVADKEICEEVTSMLRSVVQTEEGTGTAAQIEGFDVVGKTGTAEIADGQGKYLTDTYNVSFGGWLEGSSSNLVCFVVINQPQTQEGGGPVCGPVFADIMSFAIGCYQIQSQGN